MHDGIVSRILLSGLKMGHSDDSESIRVLIVEPLPQQRQELAMLAEQAGFVVSEAEDGEAALELVAAKSPDIIVFDLILPRIDGVRLMEELTLRYGLGRPKALVLTDASRIDLARAWLGAEGYLLKPVDERRFVALLRRLAAAVVRRSAG